MRANRPTRRRFAPSRLRPQRLTLAHGAMVIAGLATFVSVGRVLEDREATVSVLAVGTDTAAGTTTGELDVVSVAVDADLAFLGSFVEPGALPADLALVRPLVAGEPLLWRDLVTAGSPVLQRTVTIPVAAIVIEGLGLAVGDRIDVIAVPRPVGGTVAPVDSAGFVIVDAFVARVPASPAAEGLLAGRGEAYVTIEVSDVEALSLAWARLEGTVEIVRSTGAPAVDPDHRTQLDPADRRSRLGPRRTRGPRRDVPDHGSGAMSGLTVGVALSSRTWRGTLQRYCRDHELDVVVTPLHQGTDAFEGAIDVLVVDDDTSWLSAPFMDRAREAGIVVVGLFDPDDGEGFGLHHLRRLGVDLALRADLDVEELVSVARRHRPDPELDRRVAGLLSETVAASPPRSLIAVGGPAGAGVTEVCLALAVLWAEAAGPSVRRPLVVDVDETHPSLAARLGLALHPHLLTAVDVHRREVVSIDAAAPTCLRDCAAHRFGERDDRSTGLPFDVIVGLVCRDDWSLVRPDDVVDLLEAATKEWPAVFVRLGPQLEDLSRFVPRYELSRRCASVADRVVGVCDASASGVLRFVDWLVDARSVLGDRPVDVVVNRAPRSPSVRNQLVDQIRSVAGDRLGLVVCAPDDRRVERANWDARVPGRGPFLNCVAPARTGGGSSMTAPRVLSTYESLRREALDEIARRGLDTADRALVTTLLAAVVDRYQAGASQRWRRTATR